MIFETIETALEAHPVLSAAIHLGAVTVCLTFFLYLTGTRKKEVESTKDDKTFAYDIEGKSHFRPAKESANRNPAPAAEPGKSLQSKPPAPPPPGIHLPRSAPIRLEVIPEPVAEKSSSNAEAAAPTEAQDATQAKDQSPGDLPSSAKPDEKEFTIRFPEGMPPVDTKDTDPVAHHTKEEIAIRIYQIFQGKDAETLIAIDREEHILALNPGAEKLFQYPSHELRGKKIEDIIFLEPGDKTGTTASGSDPFDDDDDTQRAKGHAKDGSSFPVGVELEMADRPLGIILVKIHTMDLLLQPGKPVFEDLPAVEPEAARDSASTIGSIAATAAALQPILSQTGSETVEPEAVDLEPIEPVSEEISGEQDTTDESNPQPETTPEAAQPDGNVAPSPEPEEILEAKPVADVAPAEETEPEAVGVEPEAIPETIPATETLSLTEAPSAPVESGPDPVEPTEEATAPEPETPAVEEAESTPKTELSDTKDELTDSETTSDTEPESAEPEAVDLEPIEPVAEEISEAQDTTDESAPQPETTPEQEQPDGNVAPSPEPEEILEAKPVADADVAPAEETAPEAVGAEPEAIPETIPATETVSLTEAPSAPVESGLNPVEPTEEATAPEPETPAVEEAEATPQTELSDTNDELTESESASDTEPESVGPEAVDLEPIEPVSEEISVEQDTSDESAPQPETTPETEQADGIIAPSPEPEGVLEAEPVADGAPVQETEPEAVGSEPEAIPESIPATETASLTEAPSAPVESGPNPVEPTEEATAPEPETPVVEEAESTPQTELSDTNDELTDSETASDTEPESAEPEAVNIEPIEPVAEEIPEAQDTTDESAPQPETTPEPEQADGIIAPSPEPEETLETESVADVAPAEETEPEAVGSEPEAIPEPEAKPTAGIALEPVEEQPESTPVPEPETDTTNPTEDPLSETGFISHDQGNQTQDLPATIEAAVEAAEITGTDISTTEAVTPSNDAPDASPQESLPSLGSIEQPLHSISRIAKLMAVEQPDAQRIKEYAEAIEERSNRMAEQIEELKSMLKQARTQGAASSKQGPIDISRLAEILVNEASSLVSSSDKRVQCNLLDADSLYGLGNESGLTQVINSLIDLGLHCIDSGCVHIDVRSDANEPLESISESYDLNGKTLVPDSKREVIIQTRFQTSPSIRKYLESAFGPNPDFDAIEDDPAIAILAGIASRIRLSVRAMNGRFIFETPVADEVMVQTQWDMQCLREEI